MSKFRTPWCAVSAMFILNGALFGIWASRIPAVVDRHHLSPGGLGLLLLTMAAGAMLSFPLAGRAADRRGAAPVTRIIAVAYALGLVLVGLAPSVWTLALALFAFGAAHGSMDIAMNGWAAEVERRGARPVMSSFHAMFSLGAGLGAASGYFAVRLGLSVPVHFILVGLALAGLTLALAAIDWTSDADPHAHAGPVYSLPRGPLFMVGFIAFCSSIGEGGMADWSAIFLTSVAGVTEAKAALGYTIFSVAMVAMRLIGDRLVAWAGPVLAARLAGVSAAIGAATAVLSGTYPMILVGFALMGIGYAVVMPLAFSRAANDQTVSQGRAIASVATLGYGGILIGPPLLGFVAQASSLKTSFLILSVLALAITALAGRLSRDR